ncbi:Sec-independent protein translocase subunit TatA [Glutamicibacter sp. PS]|uniref:Sec-independent protein translocase subunit TatA n=1 Tax=Glutamicibacter TaxID=1742989 RepID=UPI002844C292|nr:Sec-independent protein translocase subunit TatA [Glutamicibacter sp. PS]MDR4532817.1 Sec-independent protein translocase subunit TatA [Glutamicibacter sp. PS]
MGGLQGWHLVIIIVLALLLFGAPKLPGLARSMGQSLRIFKSEVRQMKDDDPAASETIDGSVVEPKNDDEKKNS